jgi:hypothetical protein
VCCAGDRNKEVENAMRRMIVALQAMAVMAVVIMAQGGV